MMKMRMHSFGRLAPVSLLTLGGGGLGQLWGPTTREECVAVVKAAVDAGITLIDLAPRYGDGKAEQVVGEAFGGRLPSGVRVTSKCNLGNPPPERIERILRQSIEASLRLTQLERLDVFFLQHRAAGKPNVAARGYQPVREAGGVSGDNPAIVREVCRGRTDRRLGDHRDRPP